MSEIDHSDFRVKAYLVAKGSSQDEEGDKKGVAMPINKAARGSLILFLVFFVTVLGLNCSSSQKFRRDDKDSDPDKSSKRLIAKKTGIYDLNIEFNKEELTDLGRELLDDIEKGTEVSFELISKAFLEKHLNLYSRNSDTKHDEITLDEIEKKFAEVMTKLKSKTDLHQQKIDAETALGIDTYNKAYYAIPHLLFHQRLQCYSGTSFFQVLARMVLNKAGFYERNMVVIYTQGHVLYGYMTSDDQGKWHLTGIESTTKGKAKLNYGAIENLHNVEDGAFRVIDAELWMILETLSSGLMSSKDALEYALKYTDELYNGQIPVEELERKIEGIEDSRKQRNQETSVEGLSVLFAFGHVDVKEGDQPRNKFDERTIGKSARQEDDRTKGKGKPPESVTKRMESMAHSYYGDFDAVKECDLANKLAEKMAEKSMCPAHVSLIHDTLRVLSDPKTEVDFDHREDWHSKFAEIKNDLVEDEPEGVCREYFGKLRINFVGKDTWGSPMEKDLFVLDSQCETISQF